jgi:hypothetical protein
MTNIYIIVKFELNEWVKIEDWKKISDWITEDMNGTDGLQFRESAVDEKWNVYCILKWDSAEDSAKFDDILPDKPGIWKEFEKTLWYNNYENEKY